jgi:hypothetical protein
MAQGSAAPPVRDAPRQGVIYLGRRETGNCAMRLTTRDLPSVPLLLPVVAIGLFPLVMLPLLGFLGFVVLGILIGFAAIMAQLEEQGAHTSHVISHGSMSRAEQAGYNLEMQSLMRSLYAVKIVSAGLIVLGAGGFIVTQYGS